MHWGRLSSNPVPLSTSEQNLGRLQWPHLCNKGVRHAMTKIPPSSKKLRVRNEAVTWEVKEMNKKRPMAVGFSGRKFYLMQGTPSKRYKFLRKGNTPLKMCAGIFQTQGIALDFIPVPSHRKQLFKKGVGIMELISKHAFLCRIGSFTILVNKTYATDKWHFF